MQHGILVKSRRRPTVEEALEREAGPHRVHQPPLRNLARHALCRRPLHRRFRTADVLSFFLYCT